MKSNINRRNEIFKDVMPEKGSKEYFDHIEHLKKNEEKNPHIREIIKKYKEKVTKSLEAQSLSHCDFLTETTLRHFLNEFNSRAWHYGLRSMGVMFNILEVFFNYIKPEIYFELLEEENYLISYFDFIDFITSKEFTDNKKLIEDSITSDLIYNFNVGKDIENIKFKNNDKTDFIISGVSIIRRDNEATILVVAGKNDLTKKKLELTDLQFEFNNPNKVELFNDFKESIKNAEYEYEYIDDKKQYVKVLIACRIDLETMTIDARYVAEETSLSFEIVTDDIDGFINEKGEFVNEEHEEIYKNNLQKIEGFNSIFEAAKMSLYLPYYFNKNEDIIVEENLDTKLKAQVNNPISKRKFADVFGYNCSIKPVYSLDKTNSLSPDTIKSRDDLFKIETSGYWKKIGLDQIGLDKKGDTIHGRTWVNQNLSWFEANNDDLIIEKDSNKFTDINSGYVYILRNPTMGKNIFKIGLTRNEVDERVNQLSNTSIPDRLYKSQEWNTKDCVKAEREIHSRLQNYRVDPRREFFQIDYEKAIAVISQVVKEINDK